MRSLNSRLASRMRLILALAWSALGMYEVTWAKSGLERLPGRSARPDLGWGLAGVPGPGDGSASCRLRISPANLLGFAFSPSRPPVPATDPPSG